MDRSVLCQKYLKTRIFRSTTRAWYGTAKPWYETQGVNCISRPPKPWYRKDRQEWCVIINGKRHRLRPHKAEDHRLFHDITAKKTEETIPPGTVAEVIERFLDWSQEHQAERSHESYKLRIGKFYSEVKDYRPVDLRPYHIQQIFDSHSDWSLEYKARIARAIK